MAQTKTNTESKTDTKSNDKTAPESTASTSAPTSASETLAAGRAKRAEEMSIAGKKDKDAAGSTDAKSTKKAADKKPAFVADDKLKAELRGLDDEKLLERAQKETTLRTIDVSNRDVFEPTGNTNDYLNGQEVSRSAIRSEVLDFINSRPSKSAEARVIIAYMTLASGKAFKGKFDAGYLSSKDGDAGKRGMVARRLLKRTVAAPVETPAEPEAPAA